MTEPLNILGSLERGHAAAEMAADKADRLDEGWSRRVIEDLRRFARTAAGEFTIEAARLHCTPAPEGADARAWGAVTRRAVRLGYIEATGGYAPAASSHGSPKRLYRRGSHA